MAIALEVNEGAGDTASGTSIETAAIDPSATGNRMLVAFLGSSAGTPVNPTGMKWGGSGGDALTQEGSTVDAWLFLKASRFYLVAPADASRTIYGNWPSSQPEKVVGGAIFSGVDATLGTSPTPTTGTLSANATITATTVAGDVVVAGVTIIDEGGGFPTITSDGAQTNLEKFDGAFNPYTGFAMDYKVATGTSTTLTWTLGSITGLVDNIVHAFVLKEAAGGGGSGLEVPRNISVMQAVMRAANF